MKHYEFKVSVNVSDDISTDVLDSIISDVESEKKQLKITKLKILNKSKERSIKDLTSSLQPSINKKSKIKYLD